MSLGEPRCPHCGGSFTHAPLWQVPVARAPVRCPVCEGRGTMSHDFYNQLGVAASTGRVQCKSCGGKGVL